MAQLTDIKDGCPDWASGLIHQIVALEIKLGNIAKEDQWSSDEMDSLMNRAFDDLSENESLDTIIADLFLKVSKGLKKEGFNPEQTAEFINVRATSTKTTLKYCDASEVLEVLE